MVIAAALALLVQGTPSPTTCSAGSGPWPTKKWEAAAPAELALDGDSLEAIVTRAGAIPGVTSIMIVRQGKIAAEAYFHGGSRGQPVAVASITKSVTSMLVGIALGQGLIDSLDQPLIQLLPKAAPPPGRPAGTITIRQLLTMTSGLSETWYQEKPLQLRIVNLPGTTFRYSNEAVQFLIRAIGEAAGKSVLKFSRDNLWKPLGIDIGESRWPTFELNGSGNGAFGLNLTTRELGKLGLLALHDGCWDGRQLVPAGYMKDAMRKQVNAGGPETDEHGERGYGFLFWITPQGIPYMAGQGGQYVVMNAALDLVTVITARGDAPDADYAGQFRLVSGAAAAAVLATAGTAP
jgi:CubicO group peptidase (beta-lactamase class C family)